LHGRFQPRQEGLEITQGADRGAILGALAERTEVFTVIGTQFHQPCLGVRQLPLCLAQVTGAVAFGLAEHALHRGHALGATHSTSPISASSCATLSAKPTWSCRSWRRKAVISGWAAMAASMRGSVPAR